MTIKTEKWTNVSVKRLAGDADPVEVITRRAREVALAAMDEGWAGPPFDPLLLTDFLKLRIAARGDVVDARTVSQGQSLCIEYNPSRPRGRVRYSVAHEIAHTLFPDCSEQIRNRTKHGEMKGDEWQLEALCNIAAAEFLMPLGSLGSLCKEDITIDRLLELRKKFDVSMEAILLRAAHVAETPCAVFTASRMETGAKQGCYRLDYVLGSRQWNLDIPRWIPFADASVIGQCVAIGYTAKGTEHLGSNKVRVECVGIPPYPGSSYPRVAGILTSSAQASTKPAITFVKGDALQPRGPGKKVIAQVVNDATPNWGGRGFAQAVRSRWPMVQDSFRHWAEQSKYLALGNTHIADVTPEISVVSMVCQKGYGPSNRPRLRYSALEACLAQVRKIASERSATVHMPRIGCGQAGGAWFLVQELVGAELLSANVPVHVYDLPGEETAQQSLL